jgi:hypothetical protein
MKCPHEYASTPALYACLALIPSFASDPEHALPCSSVFKWYFAEFAGQYWKDLELISEDAVAYLTNSTFKKGDSSNIVIFDIDETLLSNITPYSEEVLQTENSTVTDESYTDADFVPALKSIKVVYLAAYSHGMSVRVTAPAVTLSCS